MFSNFVLQTIFVVVEDTSTLVYHLYHRFRSSSNLLPRRWRSQLGHSPCMRKVGCSNPSRDDLSLKQVVPVTARLLNTRQSKMDAPRVAVGLARKRTLAAQWSWVLSISQNLQHFIGNRDVSIRVKISRVGRKSPNKQTNKLTCQIIIQTTMQFFQHCRIVEIKSNFLFWLRHNGYLFPSLFKFSYNKSVNRTFTKPV